MEEGGGRREILFETYKQKDGPQPLDEEGEQQNPLDDHDEVAPRRVEERALHDLPSLEGDPAPHQAEDNNGEGDDPQPPDLEEDQGHDLAGEGEVLPDIDDGKTRH